MLKTRAQTVRFFLALGFLLVVVPVTLPSVVTATAQAEVKEAQVWVNTHSGVYHCPGSRWYGKTTQGKYMSECDARKHGYRPAYGDPCGSGCVVNTPPRRPSSKSASAGATALCKDGTYSFSAHRSGTCSHHGGVKEWLSPH